MYFLCSQIVRASLECLQVLILNHCVGLYFLIYYRNNDLSYELIKMRVDSSYISKNVLVTISGIHVLLYFDKRQFSDVCV